MEARLNDLYELREALLNRVCTSTLEIAELKAKITAEGKRV